MLKALWRTLKLLPAQAEILAGALWVLNQVEEVMDPVLELQPLLVEAVEPVPSARS